MSEAKPVGSSFDNPLRLIMLGSSAPGKSAAVIRLIQNCFIEEYDPSVEDSYRWQTGDVCVEIVETSGAEQYDALTNMHIRDSHVALLMYRSTSESSFFDAKCLIETIHKEREHKQPLPFVLVASFIDLDDQRQVTTEEGQALAAEHGVPYMELSSKTGQGVREAFEEAVKLGIETVANENVDESKQTGDKRCAIQ